MCNLFIARRSHVEPIIKTDEITILLMSLCDVGMKFARDNRDCVKVVYLSTFRWMSCQNWCSLYCIVAFYDNNDFVPLEILQSLGLLHFIYGCVLRLTTWPLYNPQIFYCWMMCVSCVLCKMSSNFCHDMSSSAACQVMQFRHRCHLRYSIVCTWSSFRSIQRCKIAAFYRI